MTSTVQTLRPRFAGNPPAAAPPCQTCPLAAGRLCKLLSDDPARSSGVARKILAPGTSVSGAGASAAYAGILRAGLLRIEHLSASGRRSILGLHQPGDLVGNWVPMAAGFSVEAATPVEICAYSCRSVERLLQRDASARVYVIAELEGMQERQLQQVWSWGMLDSRQRVIAFLLDAAASPTAERQPDGSTLIRMELSRQDWADITATTVETVCRTLAEYARCGFIRLLTPQTFGIPDVGALRRWAGLDFDNHEHQEPGPHPVRSSRRPLAAAKGGFSRPAQRGPAPPEC